MVILKKKSRKNFMRCMVVIDLIIVGFACISLFAFAATKDNHKEKRCEPEPCEKVEKKEEAE